VLGPIDHRCRNLDQEQCFERKTANAECVTLYFEF
jgi:hypothetical protein